MPSSRASYVVEDDDADEVDAGSGCWGNEAGRLVEPLIFLEVHRSQDRHPIHNDANDHQDRQRHLVDTQEN